MWVQYFFCVGEIIWCEMVDCEVLVICVGVGICDVIILGKIDVQGVDVVEFLNCIYVNVMVSLKVGMVCYGLMLCEDGFVWDDGICVWLGQMYYVVIIINVNVGMIFWYMEFCC